MSVIQFHSTVMAAVTEPLPVIDYRMVVIELEHEIAELRESITSQALTIVRYRQRHFRRASGKRAKNAKIERVISLAVLAFLFGWKMDFPLLHALVAQAQAATGQ